MNSTRIAFATAVSFSLLLLSSLATAAEGRMSYQGPGRVGVGMMDEGWEMGGFGLFGVTLISLVVLGIAVMAFRRRRP